MWSGHFFPFQIWYTHTTPSSFSSLCGFPPRIQKFRYICTTDRYDSFAFLNVQLVVGSTTTRPNQEPMDGWMDPCTRKTLPRDKNKIAPSLLRDSPNVLQQLEAAASVERSRRWQLCRRENVGGMLSVCGSLQRASQ